MKKVVSWLLVGIASLGFGIGLATTVTGQAAVTTKSARTYNSRLVRSRGWRIWTAPYQAGVEAKRQTGSLSGKLVQLNRVAKVGKTTYFQISRRGHVYGWVNQAALKRTTHYRLPYTYTSQLYPLKAPNACEAASLKMALSVKGIATKTSLKTIITKMPKAKSASQGFDGDPYRESPTGVTWTIYPAPLTKYAQTYDSKARNISGASKHTLIKAVKRGNAVVFAGAWRMQGQRPYHVLALVGYQKGQFLVADPYMEKGWPDKVYWTSTKNFMRVYHSRHARAVEIR